MQQAALPRAPSRRSRRPRAADDGAALALFAAVLLAAAAGAFAVLLGAALDGVPADTLQAVDRALRCIT